VRVAILESRKGQYAARLLENDELQEHRQNVDLNLSWMGKICVTSRTLTESTSLSSLSRSAKKIKTVPFSGSSRTFHYLYHICSSQYCHEVRLIDSKN
jgi:hypothetical protein